jgi:hypothetical protein
MTTMKKQLNVASAMKQLGVAFTLETLQQRLHIHELADADLSSITGGGGIICQQSKLRCDPKA